MYSLSKLKNKFSHLIKIIFFEEQKISYKRLTSYPFISGDTFSGIADLAIIKTSKKPLKLLFKDKKDIIFIENDLLNIDWVLEYAKLFKILILHNGDKAHDFKILESLSKKGIYIFSTNINYYHKNIEPIPIGIENAHLSMNGSLDYYNHFNLSRIDFSKRNLVLVSFSINNPIREKYFRILKKYKFKNKLNLSLDSYRKKLANSYFVISPPGNGIDCHRTWEAFYHKTIPVIEKKYFLFPNIDLPALIVDDLEDFLKMSKEDKLETYKKIISNSSDKIYVQWWIDHIRSKVL